jgi:hypothetical protein
LYGNSLTVWHLFGGFRDNMAVLWARKEVDQVNNAIFMYVSSLQDVGGRKVLLLSSVGDIF